VFDTHSPKMVGVQDRAAATIIPCLPLTASLHPEGTDRGPNRRDPPEPHQTSALTQGLAPICVRSATAQASCTLRRRAARATPIRPLPMTQKTTETAPSAADAMRPSIAKRLRSR